MTGTGSQPPLKKDGGWNFNHNPLRVEISTTHINKLFDTFPWCNSFMIQKNLHQFKNKKLFDILSKGSWVKSTSLLVAWLGSSPSRSIENRKPKREHRSAEIRIRKRLGYNATSSIVLPFSAIFFFHWIASLYATGSPTIAYARVYFWWVSCGKARARNTRTYYVGLPVSMCSSLFMYHFKQLTLATGQSSHQTYANPYQHCLVYFLKASVLIWKAKSVSWRVLSRAPCVISFN